MKNVHTLASVVEEIGPELLPNPQVENALTGSFLQFSGLSDLGIKLGSDANPDCCSLRGRETFFGHFPSGTSFRTFNHFR